VLPGLRVLVLTVLKVLEVLEALTLNSSTSHTGPRETIAGSPGPERCGRPLRT